MANTRTSILPLRATLSVWAFSRRMLAALARLHRPNSSVCLWKPWEVWFKAAPKHKRTSIRELKGSLNIGVHSSLIQISERRSCELPAFLLSLSHNNTLEGRDPSMIGEAFQCGLVAGLLGLRIPTLARTLVELERRGLVETCHPAGLRLKDLGGLHRISDRPPMPKDTSQATTSKLGYAAFGGM